MMEVNLKIIKTTLSLLEGSLNGRLDAIEFDDCDVIEKSFVVKFIYDLKSDVERIRKALSDVEKYHSEIILPHIPLDMSQIADIIESESLISSEDKKSQN